MDSTIQSASLRGAALITLFPIAFHGSFDRVHVTSSNGGELLGFLTAGLDQVLALGSARGRGGASTPADR